MRSVVLWYNPAMHSTAYLALARHADDIGLDIIGFSLSTQCWRDLEQTWKTGYDGRVVLLSADGHTQYDATFTISYFTDDKHDADAMTVDIQVQS